MDKIDYIYYNPIRRGLVSVPEHWLYSSVRNYILADHTILQLNELPL